MIMKMVVCDKCGSVNRLESKTADGFRKVMDLDLCPKCYGSLVDTVQCWIDEVEDDFDD